MAEFSLPANSVVRKGEYHKAPAGTQRIKRFVVYRYDPSTGKTRARIPTRWTWTVADPWCSTR